MPSIDFDVNDLHARMIRDLFLRIEILINDRIMELSEYDVQSLMFLYFRRQLTSRVGYQAAREKNGKVDCVLSKDQKPVLFYEIKTYFKKNETIKEEHFNSDINKLKKLAVENPGAKCFFVVAGLKSKFKKVDSKLSQFINSHVVKDSRKWLEWDLGGQTNSILRPGRKQKAGMSIVVSWEVKL
jgi:hypothetical protein